MTPVTEPLVHAKDEARQAEVRTDIAKALLKLHEDRTVIIRWIVGTALATAGLVITAVRL